MSAAKNVNAEFIFRCFDCGTSCESWHLNEMLNFADAHQGVCDGHGDTDGQPIEG